MHLRQRTFNRKPSSSRIGGYRLRNGQCLQNGIVRVNCVDSLDRTNTAQFALGKVALAFQLQAIGVLIEPSLKYDTDAVRLLEQLYEDHGDTIALQYGGSQLVHRVKTYRKIAPITSHSREIMQTLSRYYSNTFSDAEKQSVINLFLGIKKVSPGDYRSSKDMHEMLTDYYLHNVSLLRPFKVLNRRRPYDHWWSPKLLKSLPRAYYEHQKETTSYLVRVQEDSGSFAERLDYYLDAYRPYELTCLTISFALQIMSTVRDLMPHGSTNYSPFCLRLAPGKLKEKYLKLPSEKRLPPNPSVYASLPSTSSSSSELSLLDPSDCTDESSDLEDLDSMPTAIVSPVKTRTARFSRNLSMMKYFVEDDRLSIGSKHSLGDYGPKVPLDPHDLALYSSYHMFGKLSEPGNWNEKLPSTHDMQDYLDSNSWMDPPFSRHLEHLQQSAASVQATSGFGSSCHWLEWEVDTGFYKKYASFGKSC